MTTDAGTIRIAFAPDAAPATVRNFVTLADQGFYNNTIFHRIVPMNREGQPFVIQGGDPTGTGDGGPGWNLALEPSDLPHDFGVVGMARGDDPNSAGSQFYFALSRAGTARLDGQYCAFAYAVAGRDTLRKMAEASIADAATGRPANAPKILRVEIVPAPPRVPGENRRDQRVRAESVEPPASVPTSQTR
ncbi:MAG: peptidylprolyl isomerase [Planctomycetes bacterium]|nr:peptidylprolyl isomerase [Planctomycetota bacterium]